MEAGTIIEWRIKPGDTVHRGDIVAVVDTEKSDIEVEIFEDGIVEELVVGLGLEVPVGTVLARIASVAAPTAVVEKVAAPPAPSRHPEHAAKKRPARKQPVVAPSSSAFVRASPRARREAGVRGVDLASVTGSGPGGAVLVSDLTTPATSVTRAEREHREPADRQAAMRRALGALMSRSKREIPHYYLATTIDLSRSLGWLADANAARPVTERVLPAVLLLKATALAAREVPSMNGNWDEAFRPSPAVQFGVAVALRGGGLVAPAIHDADHLSIDALMAALRDLVQRARAGGLRSSEMSDPTITVTNLGDQGVEDVFGVIYTPQVALVGFGKVVERPWASGGLLSVRPVVRATLSADHRVSDGHEGARFLATIDRLLQNPETL